MATSATSRLRKAFRYPSEEDSDSDHPADLDEEHQEHLIAALRAEDTRKNALYANLFLAIPLPPALYFLHAFLLRPNLVALLSASSLLCTVYILRFIPADHAGPEAQREMPSSRADAARGPLHRYLVWMNAGLAAVVQIAAVVRWQRGETEEAARGSLALGILALALWVRAQLRPMDLGALERARYELKGA